ncbi:MAG: NAD-dependent epimerase/dehydratase family protein [Cyanobacteriota bacterium]|jgi:nucleoside-diphosphate-sugar epimerase
MTSVLITGSNGFIGTSLIQELLRLGLTVSVLNRTFPVKNFDRIRSFCYDGSQISIKQALAESNCEAVIHLASYFVPRHQPEDLESLVSSNLLFSTQLLDGMAQLEIKKLINTGTYWQHYQDTTYNPVSLYAATKQALEDILVYYVNSQKIDAITLKLFDTYGPGDTRRKVVNLLLEAAINETPLKLSPGEQKLSLVHVEDVVSAYEIALNLLTNRSGYHHNCYGVAHSEVYSLKQIANLVERVTGKNLKTEWGALPYRDREVMEPWTNFTALPGWQPQISLQQGLAQLIEPLE